MSDARLETLGIRLPKAAEPSFNYLPVTLHRGVAYVAGQLPKVDGEVRVGGLRPLGQQPVGQVRGLLRGQRLASGPDP